MTDFMPESAWAEPAANPAGDFWESSRPAPIQEQRASRPSVRAQRRPAAAIGADVHELLESMARKRVPRLDAVRQRLQQSRSSLDLSGMEPALQALQAATTALDFMAARGDDQVPTFVQQGEAIAAAVGALAEAVVPLLERHASEGAISRLMWIDLVIESGSLHKRVRQGAHWLAEMDQDLVARRKQPNTPVTTRAIDALARRAHAMHERLQAVHRLCRQARRVHALSEQLAADQSALCTILHGRVQAACGLLQEALEPLLLAAANRVLVPTELIAAIDARHELQVALTQAAAQIERLREHERELGNQLAAMEEKTRAPGPV
jgi:hypothetical protein